MPTCYAITAGSYSDYHVCAVFTTRELAESECFMYGAEAKVEDFPLDPVFPKPPAGMVGCVFQGFRCYESGHDTEDGMILTYPVSIAYMNEEYIGEVETTHSWRADKQSKCLGVHVWARDRSHAIKIASEKFAQYRAIQAGVA
jgi:hypothetical protein